MTGIRIRRAGPEDLPGAADLRWRWEQEVRGEPAVARDEFVARFVRWAEENEASHPCVVALRGEVVIGMAWLAVTRRVPHPRSLDRVSGDLQSVYVVPAERDRAVGERLIGTVLALARDLGLERVTVHSTDRAVTAYARRGFSRSPRLLQIDLRTAAAG